MSDSEAQPQGSRIDERIHRTSLHISQRGVCRNQ
jgi:hypothetical protein